VIENTVNDRVNANDQAECGRGGWRRESGAGASVPCVLRGAGPAGRAGRLNPVQAEVRPAHFGWAL